MPCADARVARQMSNFAAAKRTKDGAAVARSGLNSRSSSKRWRTASRKASSGCISMPIDGETRGVSSDGDWRLPRDLLGGLHKALFR